MKFSTPLLKARFIRRYKRFFADIALETAPQDVVVAHVANTGSLKTCLYPDSAALVSPASNPERKLKFTLEALALPWGGWVGVNTSWPNQLVKEIAAARSNPDWRDFTSYQSEVKISPETRLDGLLEDGQGRKRYIEIKNVTYATGDCPQGQGIAQFPDAVTERGQKHLREMMKLIDAGFEAELVFIVQRTDCNRFQAAKEIDPDYAQVFQEAVAHGLKVTVWSVLVTETGLTVNTQDPLPVL